MPTEYCPWSYLRYEARQRREAMEGMSAPRGTAPPTFDDCVQWYVEATRTSDKQWVADYAVAKVALQQTEA